MNTPNLLIYYQKVLDLVMLFEIKITVNSLASFKTFLTSLLASEFQSYRTLIYYKL